MNTDAWDINCHRGLPIRVETGIERLGNKWSAGLIPSHSGSMGFISYPLIISPVSEYIIGIYIFSIQQNSTVVSDLYSKTYFVRAPVLPPTKI